MASADATIRSHRSLAAPPPATRPTCRQEAEARGFDRIAELADYLQADELTHVKLGTHWIREMVENDPARRDDLVSWGRKAVARIGSFWNEDSEPADVHFTFLRSDGPPAQRPRMPRPP